MYNQLVDKKLVDFDSLAVIYATLEGNDALIKKIELIYGVNIKTFISITKLENWLESLPSSSKEVKKLKQHHEEKATFD